MRKYIIIILIILLIIGCKNASHFEGGNAKMSSIATEEAPMPTEETSAMEDQASVAVEQPVKAYTRKIIRDGSMEIRVEDPATSKKRIDTLIKKFNAYYSNENFNNTDFSRGYSLNIRIPSSLFDEFIAAIEAGDGEVVYKNIASRDVTEEFIDLETRLSNKRKYIDRYGQLLTQAKTVKDILEIQDKTRIIEEEVESIEGRLKYLTNQVDFSTLNLSITRKNDYNRYSPYKGSFIDRFKMAVVRGWFGLVSFTLFIIKIWPFWLIVTVLYFTTKKFWKQRKNKG